ncbi:MAG: hypothetical protein Q8N39_08160 [Pelolinea sp.]|nr:hypothetical protein [Pelolinea sp.]
MAYPLSSNVSAGDPTLSAHYNNLRSDTLNLGRASADSVRLAALLERYESRLTLLFLNSTDVKVTATATAPVSLMIAGYMVQATENISNTDAPAGAAADYYVFANRVAGSTTFTLSISTSITEVANQRRIGRFYWNGTTIVKDSVRTEQAISINSLLYLTEPQLADGRLTLSTGVAVPTTDINSATLYYTPYVGNRISLYCENYGWRVYGFNELSISLAAIGTGNYDVFIFNNNGTLTLSLVSWSNATTRAVSLVLQDGVLVKSSALSYRYLGTIRGGAAGSGSDTLLNRLVWNYYHRVKRPLLVTESIDSWTYSINDTWRPLRNVSDNKVTFVIGINETEVWFSANVLAENSASNGIGIGICLDGGNANHAQITRGIKGFVSTYNLGWYGADYFGYPGLGMHYLQIVELSGGTTTTFYGDKGATFEVVSGGIGFITM